MKKNVLLILLICLQQITAQVKFQQAYGTSSSECIFSTEPTSDLGFISAGQKMIPPAINTSYGFLLKTDSIGALQWSKNYSIPGGGCFTNCFPTKDKGYIMAGNTTTATPGASSDMFLLKTDSAGNVLWSRSYGGNAMDASCYVLPTSDSGYVLLGESNSPWTAGSSDIYIVKTDPSGNIQWAHSYGGTNWEKSNTITETTDGGFYISGTTLSFNASNTDVYAFKLNSAGTLLWSKKYGESDTDADTRSIETDDGGFMTSYVTLNYGANGKMGLIKTNALGDTLWTKTYKTNGLGVTYAWGIEQTMDHGYAFIGFMQSTVGYYRGYNLKTDSVGNMLWVNKFTNTEFLYSIRETKDTGLIITGVDNIFGMGNNDAELIKTNASGNSGCNQQPAYFTTGNSNPTVKNVITIVGSGCTVNNVVITQFADSSQQTSLCSFIPTSLSNNIQGEDAQLFPNPSSGKFTIETNSSEEKIVQVVDIKGSLVWYQTVTHQITLDLSFLSEGVYILTMKSKKGIANKKLVIVK